MKVFSHQTLLLPSRRRGRIDTVSNMYGLFGSFRIPSEIVQTFLEVLRFLKIFGRSSEIVQKV